MALSEFNKMRAQQRAVIAARLKAKSEASPKKPKEQKAAEVPVQENGSQETTAEDGAKEKSDAEKLGKRKGKE